MTNETQQSTTAEHKPPAPFGTRLKAAREALGLDRKDAAAQLRLNEKVIIMMEKDRYPVDLPVTFIRGYIRAYGKLLQIPEYEIKKAIEPIKPKMSHHDGIPLATRQNVQMTSGNYFMQFFTYLIVITMIGLVSVWWYRHTTTPPAVTVENQLNTTPDALTPNVAPPAVVGVESTPTAPPVASPAPKASTTAPAAVQNNSAAANIVNQPNAQETPPVNKPIQKKEAIANQTDPAEEDPEAGDETAYSDNAE